MENQRTIIEPKMITGGVHRDDRGSLVYNNEFDLSASGQGVKRFYTITPTPYTLRGWQGHRVEQKWFFAAKGMVRVLVVQPDDWENPSFNLTPQEFVLKEGTGDVLHVPAGHATAFVALTDDGSIGVFSDLPLEESHADSYRFPENRWYYESFM